MSRESGKFYDIQTQETRIKRSGSLPNFSGTNQVIRDSPRWPKKKPPPKTSVDTDAT